MKKLWLLLVLPLIALFFTCCGKSSGRTPSSLDKWMSNDGRIKVLSTTAMIDDLVGKIGGDKIDHLSLIIGEIDPHSYELVKGDDEKLARADLLFHNGLGLEHGASLRYRIDHHPHALAVGEKIRELHPEKILYRDHIVDPHIWMDMELWSAGVDPVVAALSEALPDEAAYFQKRGEALKGELLLGHRSIKQRLHEVPQHKRYLVTSHDAFRYFARSYLSEEGEQNWQRRFTAPEGLAPEGQISPADIQAVIDHLLRYRVNRVFSESNVSKDALRKIVEACKSHGLFVDIAHNSLNGDAMGPPGSPTHGYLPMMLHNAEILAESWTEEEKG